MRLTPDRQATILFDTIGELFGQIPADRDRIGVKSASLAPASHCEPLPGTLPHGLDAVTDDWENGQVKTREGCQDILNDIASEWAEKLGYRGPDSPTVACGWLADTTEHAYNQLDTDTWDATMSEARRVWTIASKLAGEHPEKTTFSCPKDGTTTERYPLEDGFTDWMLCPTCGTPWTVENWRKQLDTALKQAKPETMITPDDAERFGFKPATVRTWIRRREVPFYKDRGCIKVRLGDLKEHARTDV